MHEPLALKFLELLHALKSYVEQYHKDGLTWGTKVRSMTFWDNALTTAGNDPVEVCAVKVKHQVFVISHLNL